MRVDEFEVGVVREVVRPLTDYADVDEVSLADGAVVRFRAEGRAWVAVASPFGTWIDSARNAALPPSAVSTDDGPWSAELVSRATTVADELRKLAASIEGRFRLR